MAIRPERAGQESPGQRPGDTDGPEDPRPERAQESAMNRGPRSCCALSGRGRWGHWLGPQGDALGFPLPPLQGGKTPSNLAIDSTKATSYRRIQSHLPFSAASAEGYHSQAGCLANVSRSWRNKDCSKSLRYHFACFPSRHSSDPALELLVTPSTKCSFPSGLRSRTTLRARDMAPMARARSSMSNWGEWR